MNDLWLTIKAWFKGLVFVAILLYASIFIYKNNGETVHFWYWSQPTETSVFMLSSSAFIAGIIFAIILRTTWKTWRQISEIRGRSRTGKLEREMADMKAKAAMLQTRPANAEVSSARVDTVKPPASSDY